jgi:dGTPase
MINHSDGLRKIIEKRIANGMTNYMDVLRSMKGADPREVWNVYRELKKTSDFNPPKIQPDEPYSFFPEPHPAYSQWRMTSNSAKKIAQQIAGKKYESVCFLGCPTLAYEFSAFSGNSLFTALDIDEAAINMLKQISSRAITGVYDAREEPDKAFRGRFDCVVSDPPWYEHEIKLFVARSSQLVKPGGSIYFSMPDLLTKPSIARERLDFQNWLGKNNLAIVEASPVAEYSVPFFEFNAYQDIPAFTGESWRIGHWFKLKKADEMTDTIESPRKNDSWQEFTFGRKRLFLREQAISPGESPCLENLAEGLILKTVSKRSPLIKNIDVWSSRNAVLHIKSGYSAVQHIIKDLSEGRKPDYNDDVWDKTADMLRKLIDL